ncbi:DEAD/DEAH box helicase [Ancylobacter sp. G4_0304]|uniref:DEAD/DEAH box helicase n=1 Tax=Ancylobacter sp. G4_0304 TaxID=3114289 RepID=UPI0039C6BBEA
MAFTTSNPALGRALAARNYDDPTPVQAAVSAPETAGRDLLVSAQTGSGKTVAFGLAIAETLLGTQERFGPAATPLALVVAPTRELALQVQREFVWLFGETGARIVSCVGGMDPRAEQRQLDYGAHIVVGTPGRLRDHLERGRLDLSALRVAVLDEADEMLDLGFREDLEFILDATPPERRSLLFSATLPRGILVLAGRYQTDALRVEVANAIGGHADIEYRVMRIAPKEMEHAVVNVLRFYESPTAMVFCNTRSVVRHLHATLQERGFSAVALSGELSQNDRNQALQALRDGRARVCVATDVAARGIDLPNLGLVIHAELPNDSESLQHRSGRTGRAGRKGVSVLLVPPMRRRRATDLMAGIGVNVPWTAAPSPEEIGQLDRERMLADPLLTEEVGEEDIARGRDLLAAYTPEHVAAALARLYRARLPAPEEVEDPGEGRPMRERATRRDFAAPGEGGSTWFRLNIGRTKNADPRWLLPLICRRGNITKKEIGAIRIFENETAFEIQAGAAEAFGRAALGSGGKGEVIEPLPGGLSSLGDEGRGGPRRSFGKPRDERPRDDRPRERSYGERSYGDRAPREERPRDERPREDRAFTERPRSFRPREERGPEDRPAAPPKKPYRKADEVRGFDPLTERPAKPRAKNFESQGYEDRPARAEGFKGKSARPAYAPRSEEGAPARKFAGKSSTGKHSAGKHATGMPEAHAGKKPGKSGKPNGKPGGAFGDKPKGKPGR